MEEELYSQVLLDEGDARQRLEGRLFSVLSSERSILSLPDSIKGGLALLLLRRLLLLRQAPSSSSQRNNFLYHAPNCNPVPNIAPLEELPPGRQDFLTAHPWRGATPSTGQPTYLPDNAHPSSAYCANVVAQLQVKLGVCAQFIHRRIYAVEEEALGVRVKGLKWQEGSRGNVRLELGGKHKAGGARRVFKLRGFSPALTFMNANWKSDSVSAAGQQEQWVDLVVRGHGARGITQQLIEAEDLLVKASGSRHRIESVYNLAEGAGSLSLLAFEKVVGSAGGELGPVELQEVLEEIGVDPIPPQEQGPDAPPAAAANLPNAPAAQPLLVEAALQLQWLKLDAVSSQQEHEATRSDIHTNLHAKGHTRLLQLEAKGQQHDVTLAQHAQQLQDHGEVLQSHGKQLSELADVWWRLQQAQQPQQAQQAGLSGQVDGERRSVKRRLDGDSGWSTAAGDVGEENGGAAQLGSEDDGRGASMEQDVLSNGWIDINVIVGSQSQLPQPRPLPPQLPVGREPSITQLAVQLQPAPAPSSLLRLHSNGACSGALAAPLAAVDQWGLPLARPEEPLEVECQAGRETRELLQQLGVVGTYVPAACVPDRDAVVAFLVGGDCLDEEPPLTTQQVIVGVQRHFGVTSALGGMRVSEMVGELLMELCQHGMAIPAPVEGASRLGPRFAWRRGMPR